MGEVRELEMKSHMELVERVKAQQAPLRALPESDNDQKNAKLTIISQTEATLVQLQASAPIGRLVMHISPDMTAWQHTEADVKARKGDVRCVPKKAGYV